MNLIGGLGYTPGVSASHNRCHRVADSMDVEEAVQAGFGSRLRQGRFHFSYPPWERELVSLKNFTLEILLRTAPERRSPF